MLLLERHSRHSISIFNRSLGHKLTHVVQQKAGWVTVGLTSMRPFADESTALMREGGNY